MKEKVKLAVVSGGEKFFGSGSEGYTVLLCNNPEILEEGLNPSGKRNRHADPGKNLEK